MTQHLFRVGHTHPELRLAHHGQGNREKDGFGIVKNMSKEPVKMDNTAKRYDMLKKQISTVMAEARRHAATAINETIVEAYWKIHCRV